MERFLKFLQSNQAVMMAAILSLVSQLWHSVKAFVNLEVNGDQNVWNYLLGIFFAVSTSFAILMFTVRGRRNLAYFFLAVEVFINVIHYQVMGMNGTALLIATIFMCIIVPVTISVYSAEVDLDEVDRLKKEPEELANPEATKVDMLSDGQFIDEVNKLVGFDITDTNDKSGRLSDNARKELRLLWKERKRLAKSELLSRMRTIIDDSNRPLFN